MTPDRRHPACPDDERLARFTEGTLARDLVDEMEAHVASCPVCLDVMAATLPGATSSRESAVGGAPSDVRPRLVPRPGIAWRRTAVAAVLAVGLAALLGVAAPRFGGRMLAAVVAWRMGSSLGISLSAEDVAFHVDRDRGVIAVRLTGLRLGNGADLAGNAAALDLEVDARARLAVREAALHRPNLTIRVSDRSSAGGDGRVDPGVAIAHALTALLRLPVLEIRRGSVLVHGLGSAPLRVEPVDLSIARSPDGSTLRAIGVSGGGRVALDGVLGTSGRPTHLVLQAHDVPLEGTAALGAHVDGRATALLEIEGMPGDLTVRGRVDVEDAVVHGWNTFPSLLRDRWVTVPTEIRGLDLAFKSIRIAGAWRRGMLRIPRLVASLGPLEVRATVRVDRGGGLSGAGTLARVTVDAHGGSSPVAIVFDVAGTTVAPVLRPR